jgi:hypothetical protein
MDGFDGTRGASRVVVSFSPVDDRITDSLAEPSYRSYHRRAHSGPIAAGDQWAEFVSCGCGTTRDVTLRVESTDDDVIHEATEFVFEAAPE